MKGSFLPVKLLPLNCCPRNEKETLPPPHRTCLRGLTSHSASLPPESPRHYGVKPCLWSSLEALVVEHCQAATHLIVVKISLLRSLDSRSHSPRSSSPSLALKCCCRIRFMPRKGRHLAAVAIPRDQGAFTVVAA